MDNIFIHQPWYLLVGGILLLKHLDRSSPLMVLLWAYTRNLQHHPIHQPLLLVFSSLLVIMLLLRPFSCLAQQPVQNKEPIRPQSAICFPFHCIGNRFIIFWEVHSLPIPDYLIPAWLPIHQHILTSSLVHYSYFKLKSQCQPLQITLTYHPSHHPYHQYQSS